MRRALLLAIAVTACTGALPAPIPADHVGDDVQTVPTPPPPGKVQVVGAPPSQLKAPVWIDGEWEWRNGRRWAWKEGRWEEPPPGLCCWAPAITVRVSDGSLAHFPGRWKKEPANK